MEHPRAPDLEGQDLNDKYVKLAVERIPDRALLVNVASRRSKELARGAHPMVPLERGERLSHLDVALKEIAEGKLAFTLEEVEGGEA